ncbi:spore coat protein YutH [Thermolongibacillus altinsuensis]|uniref:Spore coat protein YutH n=1 Tax=Thermolongibacillus altinsuensis TaxID=575256 RepID=A0A4R1QC70_9BACL|nr:spore coat protein YutH [Thermolongibacillus altinsuensis]TCL47338.1 spore coat protein YutH [Thermolongibacillus altinsuensis]GMB09022.1 endospore coat-associated protein YutH [Thermolongibacillus altinsuensis]
MNKEIEQQYGLRVRQIENRARYRTFTQGNALYIIAPTTESEMELQELWQMGTYLLMKGDHTVASLLPTRSGNMVGKVNGETVTLWKGSVHERNKQMAKELAKLHQRGRTYPYPVQFHKRIGEWKDLWSRRLDQLEQFWKNKMKKHPENEFDKQFFESFPYYLGLTENAIQYLVDTELDDFPQPVDSATICHHRFRSSIWEDMIVKIPLDWVYDHCARDLSEWIREQWLHSSDEAEIHSFLSDYERISPLSRFSWRLIYARLLFPLHYFECVEGYYLAKDERERKRYEIELYNILDKTNEYERCLGRFHDLLKHRAMSFHLPTIHWLKN